jgi:hypothetical protein
LRNNKFVAVAFLFLVALPIFLTPASGQSSSTAIIQITPASAIGAYGTNVNLLGTISTVNGSYQIVLGRAVVASGKSDGNYVNANFTVPELPSNLYALTLQDIAANVNSTVQFVVTTGYHITPTPATVQEGSTVNLKVAVTGVELGISYSAAIAVSPPSAAEATYSKTVSLVGPNEKGTSSADVTFPDSSFSGGAKMDYAGTYTVTFNDSLAQAQFTVGILNQTVYHRGDVADRKSVV